MVLSYSAITRPTDGVPKVISIASQPAQPAADKPEQPASPGLSAEPATTPASSSRPLTEASAPKETAASDAPSGSGSSSNAIIQHLILDAGPLLSLTPLRHLATTFHTTPMVLAELRDPKAREHWERLSLAGVDVRVEHPTADSMAKVVAFAKKTGDFAVLSQTDLSVAALTYQYEVVVNGEEGIRTVPGQKIKKKSPVEEVATAESDEAKSDAGRQDGEVERPALGSEGEEEQNDQEDMEGVTRSIDQVLLDGERHSEAVPDDPTQAAAPTDQSLSADLDTTASSSSYPAASELVQDIDDESDGGEWITPSNLTNHRSRDLGLITPSGPSAAKPPAVACMTGDYAVQNILLGMGLGLIGEGGKKISKVKSWVLRCHACFKICKDPSKRFCPSCGNATLLRTTVSTDSKTGQQSVHLKKNFQYHTRGTKYTIPDAKMGRAKGQQKGGSGLILREDQVEWSDAVRQQDRQKVKEEKRAAKGALEGWNDPDWMPEIITVGMSGKGRSGGHGMPTIGHGRKNPNQAKKKR